MTIYLLVEMEIALDLNIVYLKKLFITIGYYPDSLSSEFVVSGVASLSKSRQPSQPDGLSLGYA